MTRRTKQILLIITYTVALLALFLNLSALVPLLGRVCSMLMPVLVGLMIAFVLNVPMKGIELALRKLTSKRKGLSERLPIRGLSLLLTLGLILLVIVLVFTMVIPEVAESIRSVDLAFQQKLPELLAWLSSQQINIAGLSELLQGLNLEDLVNRLISGAGPLLDSVVNVVTSTFSVLSSGLISLVIAIYVLLSKESLSRQFKKLLYALMKPQYADNICNVGRLINETYTKFLGGQCVEACILGVLMLVVFSIVGLPYGGLVAVLAAICSFVPYVGAFIACAVGAVLTFLTSPFQALLCIVVYLAVQFVENQFIYPRVVGSSVGLSPLWTLVAVMLGGELMGLVGMVFFIPLVSVVYTLLSGYVHDRLAQKNLTIR